MATRPVAYGSNEVFVAVYQPTNPPNRYPWKRYLKSYDNEGSLNWSVEIPQWIEDYFDVFTIEADYDAVYTAQSYWEGSGGYGIRRFYKSNGALDWTRSFTSDYPPLPIFMKSYEGYLYVGGHSTAGSCPYATIDKINISTKSLVTYYYVSTAKDMSFDVNYQGVFVAYRHSTTYDVYIQKRDHNFGSVWQLVPTKDWYRAYPQAVFVDPAGYVHVRCTEENTSGSKNFLHFVVSQSGSLLYTKRQSPAFAYDFRCTGTVKEVSLGATWGCGLLRLTPTSPQVGYISVNFPTSGPS